MLQGVQMYISSVFQVGYKTGTEAETLGWTHQLGLTIKDRDGMNRRKNGYGYLFSGWVCVIMTAGGDIPSPAHFSASEELRTQTL